MINRRLVSASPQAVTYIKYNVVFQTLTLMASTATVLLMANLAASVLTGTAMTYPVFKVGLIALLWVMKVVFQKQCAHWAARSSHCVKKQMRTRLFEKMASMGPEFAETVPQGQLTQLASEGVEQLEAYFSQYLPQFFYAMIAPVLLAGLIAFWDWKSALALFVCVPLIPVSIALVQTLAKKLLGTYWGKYTALSDSFLENLKGLTTLKVYQADARKHAQMNEEAEHFRKITMKVLIMQLNSISIMDVTAYGGAALGMILALGSFGAGTLSLERLIAIVLLSAEFFLPMRQLGSFFHVSMNGSAAADRMFKILDAKAHPANEVPEVFDGFRADGLDFVYESGTRALKNLRLDIPAIGFTGITGESGSGKSTLAKLLCGRLHGSTGALETNGIQLEQTAFSWMEANCSVLDFESRLFSGTLRDNLLMADIEATETAMIEALQRAGIWSYFQSQQGLDTLLEEGASNLSGGQRQRVAFARALLKNSPVLILDEATSAVDADTELHIMKEAAKEADKRCVICISHRLANLEKADQILVMKQAEIVQQGTHEKLSAKEGEYARLLLAQSDLEKYAQMSKGEVC